MAKSPKEFKSFYKTVKGNEGNKCNYPTRLDTYGCGCQHNCNYCYAKSLLDFRGLWNPLEPSVADINKISNKIQHLDRSVVRIGGMTDCFMPMESHYRVTYKTIKELNRRRIPYLIVTKSNLIARGDYLKILDKELAHVQVSLTTTSDDLYKRLNFEFASLPSARIQAIEKLVNAGIDTQVRLSPFIPQFIDFDALANINCDKILVEFLRVNSWIKKWFDIDFSEYIIKQSGYSHLPLAKKLEYINKIHGFERVTVCEDETEAYEYWKNNFNPNKNDCCDLRRSSL